MAISFVEYSVMRFLRENNLFPLGGDLLEIGEANWYGDVDPGILRADISKFAIPERRQSLLTELDDALKSERPGASWDIAKIYWDTFFHPSSITAVDLHGTEKALKLDLNAPIDLKRQFHVVNNCGTLEHVFNVGLAFKTIHDHTLPGGFMIHQTPFIGWIDHGFYNFNPTLFWDLAAINNYHICVFLYAELNPPKTIQLEKPREDFADGQEQRDRQERGFHRRAASTRSGATVPTSIPGFLCRSHFRSRRPRPGTHCAEGGIHKSLSAIPAIPGCGKLTEQTVDGGEISANSPFKKVSSALMRSQSRQSLCLSCAILVLTACRQSGSDPRRTSLSMKSGSEVAISSSAPITFNIA